MPGHQLSRKSSGWTELGDGRAGASAWAFWSSARKRQQPADQERGRDRVAVLGDDFVPNAWTL